MAGDGVIQSSQLEDMSASENDTSSTVGLEQAAGVERIGVEQLKLQGCILDSDGSQSIEVEHWTPLLQSHCKSCVWKHQIGDYEGPVSIVPVPYYSINFLHCSCTLH